MLIARHVSNGVNDPVLDATSLVGCNNLHCCHCCMDTWALLAEAERAEHGAAEHVAHLLLPNQPIVQAV